MTSRPRNIAAAIRLKQSHIQEQLAKGRSRNDIRKELIANGLPPVSRAYFNEIVDDFVSPPSLARPQLSEPSEASPPQQQVQDLPVRPAAAAVTRDPVIPSQPIVERGGNFVDDRYDNAL